MARIQYQQSQGKGWSNIDPGYISLSRMREKQREDEQGEDRRLQEEKQRNAQAEANVERIQKATEANLKGINIESKVSQTQEAALRVNKGIAEQNFIAETNRNKVKSALESIVEWAPSALQAKQKMDQADWEATYKDAVQYYSTYGIEENRKFRTDLLEDEAFLGGQRLELTADGMQDDDAPSEQVMFVRGKNKAIDYALMKVKAMDAGNNYKSTLQTALLKAGLTDPAEQEAFINDFNIRYLQGHGLVTNNGKPISADFLGPTFEKMSNARSSIIGSSRLQKALTDSQAHADKYKSIAITALQNTNENIDVKREAAENWLNRLKRVATDIYGTRPNGTEVKETFLKGLVYSGASSDDIQEILEEIPFPPGGEGANWYDNKGNKQLISKYLNEYQADKKVADGLSDQQKKFDQDQDINSFVSYLSTPVEEGGWDRNQEIIDKKIDEWNKKGYNSVAIQEAVGHYKDSSVQQLRDGDADLQNILEKRDNLTLTNEDLKDPTLTPGIITQELRQETAERRALIDQANYVGTNQDGINKKLRNLLVYRQTKIPDKSVLSDTLDRAEKGAEKFFNQCIIDGGDKDKCILKLDDEIKKKKEGLFEVRNYGDDDSREAGSYFVNFTLRAEQEKKKHLKHVPLDTEEQVSFFLESTDTEDKTVERLVIPPDNFKAVENRIERGLPFEYHDVAVRMSRRNPDRYPTPMHFYRDQAYLAKSIGLLDNDKVFNFETLQRAWIDRAEEPTVKYKISTAQTNEDLQKGLELANNPSSARNPDFMSNALRSILTDPENTTSENFPFGGKGLPSPLLINYEEHNLSW